MYNYCTVTQLRITVAGYNLIQKIRRLEEECDSLGFMLANSKHGNFRNEFGDIVAIKPKDDNACPIYSRDAEFFCGSIDELERWLQGLKWARDYDRMLGISNEKKRERKEQDWRNRKLMQAIADPNGNK